MLLRVGFSFSDSWSGTWVRSLVGTTLASLATVWSIPQIQSAIFLYHGGELVNSTKEIKIKLKIFTFDQEWGVKLDLVWSILPVMELLSLDWWYDQRPRSIPVRGVQTIMIKLDLYLSRRNSNGLVLDWDKWTKPQMISLEFQKLSIIVREIWN